MVNDQTLPGVLPPLETAVTRQKYVVDGSSVPVAYDAAMRPLPASDGLGVLGAAGGPATPAVVNAQIDDAATSEGLTGVAFVRDTAFQK